MTAVQAFCQERQQMHQDRHAPSRSLCPAVVEKQALVQLKAGPWPTAKLLTWPQLLRSLIASAACQNLRTPGRPDTSPYLK